MSATITLAKVFAQKPYLSSEFRDILLKRTFARVWDSPAGSVHFFEPNMKRIIWQHLSPFLQTGARAGRKCLYLEHLVC